MGMVDRVIERSLADKQASSSSEVHQLIEATYAVIARTGRLDPSVRAILAEAGLSNPAFYRYFRSKDELLLVMLDEGRRQLADYLDQRTDRVDGTAAKIGEWVRWVLAQAADPEAAKRTRPFVTSVERLHTQFPAAQEESERQLIDQLATLLPETAAAHAATVYTVVFGTLERYLREDRSPPADDVDQLVAFVLAGLGIDS